MAQRLDTYFWVSGQTVGVVLAKYIYRLPSKDGVIGAYGAEGAGLAVTNNGEIWAATLNPPHPYTLPLDAYPQRTKKPGQLTPEFRLPLEWAKKAMKGKPAGTTLSIGASQLAQVMSFPGPFGPITYAGFTKKIAKSSAHSLEKIHDTIVSSITKCDSVWHWHPVNLEMKFHETTHAMGLAYNPGGRIHKISLHTRLLKSYSLDSIGRVMAHELCHHMRDERFPRSNNEHDATFCRELQLVDPLSSAHGGKACVKFYDQVDPAIVAAAPRQKLQPIWSPNAGFLTVVRLKSGKITLKWTGISGIKSGKWSAPLTDLTLLDLLKRFSNEQWHSVETKTVGLNWPDVTNLRNLTIHVLKSWPRLMDKTTEYIQSLMPAEIAHAS